MMWEDREVYKVNRGIGRFGYQHSHANKIQLMVVVGFLSHADTPGWLWGWNWIRFWGEPRISQAKQVAPCDGASATEELLIRLLTCSEAFLWLAPCGCAHMSTLGTIYKALASSRHISNVLSLRRVIFMVFCHWEEHTINSSLMTDEFWKCAWFRSVLRLFVLWKFEKHLLCS